MRWPCQITLTLNAPSIIPVNNDDDNTNGIPDFQEWGPQPDENDLVPVQISMSGCPPGVCLSGSWPQQPEGCPLWVMYGGVYSSLRAFVSPDKTFDRSWPPPPTAYLESLGVNAYPCRQVSMILATRIGGWVCGADDPYCGCSHAGPLAYGAKVTSLQWEKAYEDNLDLDTCPNNGGTRIFPGKLSPEDATPFDRRQVDLVATVEPPIPGAEVYFRVFDVDDPFDQLHGPNAGYLNDIIPNVDLIDNDTDGGDNRPVGQTDPAVGIYGPFTTDECGQVTLRLEVSMQPGNNYRAAASLIQEAMTQDTIYNGQPVTPEEHADALSAVLNANGRWYKNGNYNGYSCPRTSMLLT